jgi:photosystem II stability/assembly factor-like uncharacterized protein
MRIKKLLFFLALIALLLPEFIYSQWELMNGPAGGGGFIISPKPGTFFVSTTMGIYRSTDNTYSWHSVNNGVGFFFRDMVWAMSGKGNTILFGTLGHVISGARVYLSTNNGDNWIKVKSGRRINSILFKDNYIFYTCDAVPGGDEGLFRSSDDGNSWVNLYSNNVPGHLSSKGDYVFYTAHDSLLRSTDYGDTWEYISNVTPAFMFSNTNYLFIAAGNYVHKSSDNGLTWDTVDAGFTIKHIVAKGNYLFGVDSWDYSLKRSTDFGSTWELLYTNNIQAYGLCVRGNTLYTSYDGVLRSFDNGNTWSFRNTGLTTLSIRKLFANNSYVFAATGEGMSYSSNNGQTWSVVYDTLVKGTPQSFAYLNNSYFCATDFGLFKSTNNGIGWSDIKGSFQAWGPDDNILGSAFGQLYLYSPLLGILRSSNLGTNWVLLPQYLGGDVRSFVQNSSFLFAATTNGVFRSSNLGNNWTAVDSGLNALDITDIASTGSQIYCITSYDVLKSDNNGDNWYSVRNNIPSSNIYALTVNNGNIYVARRYDGVYMSSNGGANWNLIADGLVNSYVGSLAANDRYIFAGTLAYVNSAHESGVYRLDTGIVVSVPGVVNTPLRYSLSQNYPNPFNPATNIKFDIPENSFVRLVIYDIEGREVAVPVNESKHPGSYTIKFDGTNLSSGVYFFRLEAGDYTETKKMVLIK